MSGSHSTTTNTLGVERRASFAPTTPKRLSTSEAGSAMKNRRVDDESEIEKKYSFGEVLGQGAFGVVREVTNKQTHQQLAMKIVQKDKVSRGEGPARGAIVCIHVHVRNWFVYVFSPHR